MSYVLFLESPSPSGPIYEKALMTVIPQPTNHVKSAAAVRSFIKDVEVAYLLEYSRFKRTERRSVERINVTMPVHVTALDDQLQPLDYHYHAVTRNISQHGVGLVSTNPIGRGHVQLTFEPYLGEPFTVVARVIHCGDVGYYFQVGCEFVSSTS